MDYLTQLETTAQQVGCKVLRDEPMCRHTTFRIGGPADLFLIVPDEKALSVVLRESKRLEIPVFPLGNGSNLLISDKGIRGVVVTLGEKFSQTDAEGEILSCGAAAALSAVSTAAANHSLTGAEFLCGIPGSVGGAALMNAGAYGGEIGKILIQCRHMNLDGTVGTLSAEEIHFGYRHTVYMENGAIILGVKLKLSPGNQEEIRTSIHQLLQQRREKQPLEYPSAGSVFKRPVGHFAGALIEQCGLKGTRIGGAEVSPKHAGFIVNMGGATCSDVLALISLIQETVLRETGVALECEVKRMGET